MGKDSRYDVEAALGGGVNKTTPIEECMNIMIYWFICNLEIL